MEVRNEITLRVDKIKDIFQHITARSTGQEDLKSTNELENTDNEFRSVAYEAAAMALALRDISKGTSLTLWRKFMEGPGAKHTSQVHVGLGWAAAQQRIPLSPIISQLDQIMRFRALDGYGYYDGIFRQRKTINARMIPEDMDGKYLMGYDQGIGRSLWYTFKGEADKICGIIGQFPSYRHEDLWRGTGIACVYVGGYDEDLLKELLTSSVHCHTQLPVSAALVARTRMDANALTQDTELACRVWCNCSAEEAVRITVNAEESISPDAENAYRVWLSNIREQLNY